MEVAGTFHWLPAKKLLCFLGEHKALQQVYSINTENGTNRFKEASSGAGVIDQTIQWGEEDTPGHVINYMQGLPWENPKNYQIASPLYAFRPGINTATLLHAGEEDAMGSRLV